MQKNIKPRIHVSEQGQSSLEFIVVLAFFMFLISWMFLTAPLFHIAIEVRQAAYDCAFSAVQTKSQEQGYLQGMVAGTTSFAASGLSSDRATIRVSGNWDTGGLVTCRASYNVPLESFPLRQVAPVPGQISYSYSLPVQKYKSKWE